MPRVVHFEIHAGDPARAINFYEKTFGWTFQKWEGPMEYWLVNTGPADQPGINGGLMPRRGELDGQAVIAYDCTVDVAAIDESIATVVANNDRAYDALARHGLAGLLQRHRRQHLRHDAE